MKCVKRPNCKVFISKALICTFLILYGSKTIQMRHSLIFNFWVLDHIKFSNVVMNIFKVNLENRRYNKNIEIDMNNQYRVYSYSVNFDVKFDDHMKIQFSVQLPFIFSFNI